MAPKKMIMPKSLPNKNDMYSPIELNSKKNPLNSLKNLIISFIVIALSYLGANIRISPQTTKDLRGKVRLIVY
jgi:hypothetical protein